MKTRRSVPPVFHSPRPHSVHVFSPRRCSMHPDIRPSIHPSLHSSVYPSFHASLSPRGFAHAACLTEQPSVQLSTIPQLSAPPSVGCLSGPDGAIPRGHLWWLQLASGPSMVASRRDSFEDICLPSCPRLCLSSVDHVLFSVGNI